MRTNQRASDDLHTRVVEHLGSRIVSGELPPGTTFRLDDLAAELKVSKSVVREAVRALETARLMFSRRHVGVSVRTPSEWCVLDARVLRWHAEANADHTVQAGVLQMILGVAPEAARCVAGSASPGELQELVTQVLRSGSPAALLVKVLRATENPVYEHLAELADLVVPFAEDRLRWAVRAVDLAVALSESDAPRAYDAMAEVTAGWAAQLREGSADEFITLVP
jgi:DNA-binding FadR family transcriptional regulator